MWIQTWFDLASSPAFEALAVKTATFTGSYVTIMLQFLPYVMIFSFVMFLCNWLIRKITWLSLFGFFKVTSKWFFKTSSSWYKQELDQHWKDFKYLKK